MTISLRAFWFYLGTSMGFSLGVLWMLIVEWLR